MSTEQKHSIRPCKVYCTHRDPGMPPIMETSLMTYGSALRARLSYAYFASGFLGRESTSIRRTAFCFVLYKTTIGIVLRVGRLYSCTRKSGGARNLKSDTNAIHRSSHLASRVAPRTKTKHQVMKLSGLESEGPLGRNKGQIGDKIRRTKTREIRGTSS